MPRTPTRKRRPSPLAVAKAEAQVARTSMNLQLEKFKREADQKELILGRMEAMLANTCDAMAQLAEFSMEQAEVTRLRKICDVMLDLRRAMSRFALDHQDLLDGVNTSRRMRDFGLPPVTIPDPKKSKL